MRKSVVPVPASRGASQRRSRPARAPPGLPQTPAVPGARRPPGHAACPHGPPVPKRNPHDQQSRQRGRGSGLRPLHAQRAFSGASRTWAGVTDGPPVPRPPGAQSSRAAPTTAQQKHRLTAGGCHGLSRAVTGCRGLPGGLPGGCGHHVGGGISGVRRVQQATWRPEATSVSSCTQWGHSDLSGRLGPGGHPATLGQPVMGRHPFQVSGSALPRTQEHPEGRRLAAVQSGVRGLGLWPPGSWPHPSSWLGSLVVA